MLNNENTKLSESQKQSLADIERQFITLRSSGTSIRDIAKTLKKSTHTICDLNKKFSKDILTIRNNAFCELQKKIIDLKTSRLDFLKGEIERISKILKKQIMVDEKSPFSGYNDSLEIFVKLSELMSAFEDDMLRVGVNFKSNIEPESNIVDDMSVAQKSNNAEEENEGNIIDNKEIKADEGQVPKIKMSNNSNGNNVAET